MKLIVISLMLLLTACPFCIIDENYIEASDASASDASRDANERF
jgi:hypothetical protein